MIAYKFPDVIQPGGSVRLEKLLKYLPESWRPVVLSVQVPEEALVDAVHTGSDVHRTRSHYGAFARAYRAMHLEAGSVARRKGIDLVRRLKNLFLVPDDVVLWWPRAWPRASKLIREHRIDLVFSSGPPYSCLLLGALVAKRAGLPFIADLRDDWAGNPLAGRRNLTQSLTEFPMERWMIKRSSRIVHVTEASLELYHRRYPDRAARMALIRNGYDEADFEDWEPQPAEEKGFLIVHTGSLKQGRSPEPLLQAMALLGERNAVFRQVRFRQVGTTHREYVEMATKLGLEPQVTWTERLERKDALAVARGAGGLLLLPTQTADTAIPGKAYEYLRAMKPILAISRPNESTRFLEQFSGVTLVRPEDVGAIADAVASWLTEPRPTTPNIEQVRPYSRQKQAEQMAGLFDQAIVEK